MYNIFLDDLRFPKDAFLQKELAYLAEYSKIPENEWVIVRNYDEFVKTIEERGIPNACSLDSDLCMEHMRYYVNFLKNPSYYEWENFQNKCGIHCAKYLKDKLTSDSNIKVYVHSANIEGSAIIRKIMTQHLG